MVFDRIVTLGKGYYERGTDLWNLGRNMFDASFKVYQDWKTGDAEPATAESSESKNAAATAEETNLRTELEKNFAQKPAGDQAELAKQTSMKSHKVKAPKVGEKWNSNMVQKNFENHQGN